MYRTEQNKTLLTNTTLAILHEWHKSKQYKYTKNIYIYTYKQCNKLFKDVQEMFRFTDIKGI